MKREVIFWGRQKACAQKRDTVAPLNNDVILEHDLINEFAINSKNSHVTRA